MQEWLDTCWRCWRFPASASTLFVVSFISATLLPLGSEPALFGLIKLNPELFWPAMLVATAGNTLGGMLDWWLGYGAHKVVPTSGATRARTSRRSNGWNAWGPRPACCPGCRSSATRCARWRAG
jgi:membrane protein YqaA with SNARE-associated domain